MKELDGVTLESVVITKSIGEALQTLISAGKAKESDFPLLLHIYDIITKKTTVKINWKEFESIS
jgi:hypothetical protein